MKESVEAPRIVSEDNIHQRTVLQEQSREQKPLRKPQAPINRDVGNTVLHQWQGPTMRTVKIPCRSRACIYWARLCSATSGAYRSERVEIGESVPVAACRQGRQRPNCNTERRRAKRTSSVREEKHARDTERIGRREDSAEETTGGERAREGFETGEKLKQKFVMKKNEGGKTWRNKRSSGNTGRRTRKIIKLWKEATIQHAERNTECDRRTA